MRIIQNWEELRSKMDCYLPNNPQFGISVEYTTQITPAYPYDTGQKCPDGLDQIADFSCDNCTERDLTCLSCEKRVAVLSCERDFTCLNCEKTVTGEGVSCEGCEKSGRERSFSEEFNLGQENADGSYWSAEDLGSLSLSGLDIETQSGLFPDSPVCNGNHKAIQNERIGPENGDVLVQLKHHSDCIGEEMHSATQMVVPPPSCASYPYYEQYPSPAALFPTMSVNVSMNMTMHSYSHDQVQWNQSPSAGQSMMYPQSPNLLSAQSAYQCPTYSFTADFRTPPQNDPMITSTSFLGAHHHKNVFRPVTPDHDMQKGHLMKSRSKVLFDQGYPYYGEDSDEFGYNNCGTRVQVGALSTCSGSEDEQKPNLCRICGKTYARPSTLKTHLRTHSGERPYRCADCDKSFSQAANLTAHVRTHTGQKPFRCPICDRRFSQSSSVTTHMRTHSGERPYRCRSCKKAFSDSSTLTKHLRIHSGEKPYQCKLCLLRFSQSGNLNRHMRVHGQAGPFD